MQTAGRNIPCMEAPFGKSVTSHSREDIKRKTRLNSGSTATATGADKIPLQFGRR
jgi:hypothetical protein